MSHDTFNNEPPPDKATSVFAEVSFDSLSQLSVGRAPDADLRLDGLEISKHHASFILSNGQVTVEDNDSTHGVYVNGERISGRRTVEPFDLVQIGPFVLRADAQHGVAAFDTRSKTGIDCVDLVKVSTTRAGGKKTLLDDIGLTIRPNDFIGLLGPSDSGASMLLETMGGRNPPTGGQVLVNNLDLFRHFDSLKQAIGYVAKDDTVHAELTVTRTLYYEARLRLSRDASAKEINHLLSEIMEAMGLSEQRDVVVGQLSLAQRKRVSIAVELITKPSVIFLDEPTAGLDPSGEAEIIELCHQLAKSGRTIVVSTNTSENCKLFDKVVVLMRGRLVFDGAPQEALDHFEAGTFAELWEHLEAPIERMMMDALGPPIPNSIAAHGETPEKQLDRFTERVAEEWKQRFRASDSYRRNVVEPLSGLKSVRRTGIGLVARRRTARDAILEWEILTRRYLEVSRAKLNLPILFGRAPADDAQLQVDSSPEAVITSAMPSESEAKPDAPLYLDDNVQFTVYRPKTIVPQKWYSLLAFAHLSEKREDAGEDEPDPIAEVRDQAQRLLREQVDDYQNLTQDTLQAIPREGTITFLPTMPGIEFNPPSRSFTWSESVHREDFRLRAAASSDKRTLKGRLSVFLGDILLADIPLSIRVDSNQKAVQPKAPLEESHARPYRKIFASYSHQDKEVVEQFERLAEALGDRYLRDVRHLRSGEMWAARLEEMIVEADIFQLFWSANSMHSQFVRQEWEYALSLQRPNFVRPTYWEEPFPTHPESKLPPEELMRLHFQRIRRGVDSEAQIPPPPAVSSPPVPSSPKESRPVRRGEELPDKPPRASQRMGVGASDDFVFPPSFGRRGVGGETNQEESQPFYDAREAARSGSAGPRLRDKDESPAPPRGRGVGGEAGWERSEPELPYLIQGSRSGRSGAGGPRLQSNDLWEPPQNIGRRTNIFALIGVLILLVVLGVVLYFVLR